MKNDEQFEDWIAKYAKLISRKVFTINSNIKLNPHEPDCVKDVISQEVKALNGKNFAAIYYGGKLVAYQTFDGQLIISSKFDLEEAFKDP
jgi:hypothetical protein